MANKIRMDLQILESTLSSYNKCIDDLKMAKNDVKNAVNTLDRDWKGEAKNAYSNIKSVNWEKGINEHISRIEFIRDSLKKVKESYISIENEGKTLKNRV